MLSLHGSIINYKESIKPYTKVEQFFSVSFYLLFLLINVSLFGAKVHTEGSFLRHSVSSTLVEYPAADETKWALVHKELFYNIIKLQPARWTN